MADTPVTPVLRKPPGYIDLNTPSQPGRKPTPPGKPVLPTSLRPKKRRRRCCRIICCFLCIFLLIFMILFIISGGLFYLWFDPKPPVFHLQSFHIPRFIVSVKPDGTFLSAKTVTRIEIKNPNGKLTYYYGGSDVDVTVGKHQKTKLGSAFVDGFVQKKKNTTRLKIETQVKDLLVDDSTGVKLRHGYKNKDLVINVEVKSKVGLGVEGIKIGFLSVNVLCGEVSLKQLGDVMPKCTINMFKWINIH